MGAGHDHGRWRHPCQPDAHRRGRPVRLLRHRADDRAADQLDRAAGRRRPHAHRPGRDVHGPDRRAARPARPARRPRGPTAGTAPRCSPPSPTPCCCSCVAAFILYEAFERLGDAPDVPGVPMIVVALAGLLANAVVVLLLRSHSEQSLAVKGAYMEVVADTVGSIGVLIAGIVTVTTQLALRRRRGRGARRAVGAAARDLARTGGAAHPVRVVADPHRRRGAARPPCARSTA